MCQCVEMSRWYVLKTADRSSFIFYIGIGGGSISTFHEVRYCETEVGMLCHVE